MTQKKRKHTKGRKRRNADRQREVMRQKMILAVIVTLIVVAAAFSIRMIFSGKDAEMTVNEGEDVAESSPGDLSQPESAEEEQPEKDLIEEMMIAAEVGAMDDAEDQQAQEDAQENKEDIGIRTDNALQGNEYEQSGVSLGIDVAKWQGTIDWQQVKDAGVDFAIIRVGYRTMKTGLICEDPCARYNLQQAQAAGIKLGAYFFSTAVSEEEAKEEAAWVCGFVAQYPMTYPVAYNCEGFKSPESRQYDLTQAERTRLASAFLDYVRAKGYEPMFYASKNEMEGSALWDMDKLEGNYKIWVSQYPDVPYPETKESSYTGSHDMWQYTSSGIVPGVPKGADMNVAYFGYTETAQPKDATPPEIAEADPEALIRLTEVDETVTAKIETNLRSVPSTSDDATIVTKLRNGETAQRTGIGHNGWSRVIYNGEKLYAVSSYLTTDLSAGVQNAGMQENTAEADTAAKNTEIDAAAENAANTAAGNTAQQTGNDSVYKSVNEPVTAKNSTNLRSAADSSDAGNIVATLQYGEVAIRTGVGSNGWSRLEYNGQTVYAISSYLTTDGNYKENNTPSLANPEAGIIFEQVNEAVTAKIETNLRNLPTTQEPSSVVASLKNGETVTRTGIGSNGWSRLEYNGQTVYAVSSYLVTAVSADEG